MPNPARLHALLIGIDAYTGSVHPLRGCVRDTDAVEQLLRGRLLVPPERIRKLCAPAQARVPSEPATDACLPTGENIRTALRGLTRAPVQPGDSVFIFYAGHGGSQHFPSANTWLEGLVPLDVRQNGMLYDLELNRLLQDIADYCGSLTVVLDCCHAAGVTRADDLATTPRYTPLPAAEGELPAVVQLHLCHHAAADPRRGTAYSVLAACHADEQAVEVYPADCAGGSHGALTYCLLQVLARVDDQRLATLELSTLQEQLVASFQRLGIRHQHPFVVGSDRRSLFGGFIESRPAGFPVEQLTMSQYRLSAGELAGLHEGAVVAVYAPCLGGETSLPQPVKAPPLLMLQVASTTADSALATPLDQAALSRPPALPAGARGRLHSVGNGDAVRVWLAPDVSSAVSAAVASYKQAILLPREAAAASEVMIRSTLDGAITVWLTSSLVLESAARGVPLGTIPAGSADVQTASLVAALQHLALFMIPLRLARRRSQTKPAALAITPLSCAGLSTAECVDLEVRLSARRPLPHRDGAFDLPPQMPVCIQVSNRSSERLYVTLVCCSMEGQVQLIDTNVAVPAHSERFFWEGQIKGAPFLFEGMGPGGLDQLVAIGVSQPAVDLRCLDQTDSLALVISDAAASRSLVAKRLPRLEATAWTATEVALRVSRHTAPGSFAAAPVFQASSIAELADRPLRHGES